MHTIPYLTPALPHTFSHLLSHLPGQEFEARLSKALLPPCNLVTHYPTPPHTSSHTAQARSLRRGCPRRCSPWSPRRVWRAAPSHCTPLPPALSRCGVGGARDGEMRGVGSRGCGYSGGGGELCQDTAPLCLLRCQGGLQEGVKGGGRERGEGHGEGKDGEGQQGVEGSGAVQDATRARRGGARKGGRDGRVRAGQQGMEWVESCVKTRNRLPPALSRWGSVEGGGRGRGTG